MNDILLIFCLMLIRIRIEWSSNQFELCNLFFIVEFFINRNNFLMVKTTENNRNIEV